MNVRLLVIAFVLAVVVSGCGAIRPIPVTDSVPAFNLGWASVAPPRGKDWYVIGTDRSKAVYGKRISPRHSFIATVIVSKIDNCCKDSQDLVARVRAIQEENRKEARYHFVKQEVEAANWEGLTCVIQRLVAQDKGSTIAPGVPLNYFQKDLICMRPGISGEIVNLSYSERDGLPEGTPDLVAEGEAFFKGLKPLQNK